MPTRCSWRAIIGCALLCIVAWVDAVAQGAATPVRCSRLIVASRGPLNHVELGAGTVTYFSRGADFRCPSERMRLIADSAEVWDEPSGTRYEFIGAVRYTQGDSTDIKAHQVSYLKASERLVARGTPANPVDARMANGVTLRGPLVDYSRAAPGVRAEDEAHASGRPHITFREGTDPRAETSVPTAVDADIVDMYGKRLIIAKGSAVVTRPDMIARAGEINIFRQTEQATLSNSPSITGTGSRAFTIKGSSINLASKERKLQRIFATGKAQALREKEFTLDADTLDLRIDAELLTQAYAYGDSGATATSKDHTVRSDSMDIRMPGQRLTRVYAVNRAIVDSRPDTASMKHVPNDSLESNRLWGDTIVAQFRAASRTDSTNRALDALRAAGNARSYYQLAPQDTTQRRPAVNYCRGANIEIRNAAGAAPQVKVAPMTSCLRLDPGDVRTSPSGRGSAPPPPGTPPP